MHDALAFVDRCARALAPGRALDVACGRGRHLALLAGLGWHATGVDRDEQALAEAATRAPAARLLARDVEAEGLPAEWGGSFDLVVVTFFLHRPLFADLARVLAPSGRLVLETFHDENRRRRSHPRRPHLALGPAEGRALCEGVGLLVLESDEAERGDVFTTRVLAARPA
ncbi:MAG TPA: methyltransferase domain-containing protein [Polyangiaceae bacterium]|nr:methyltransferase domain-containing protein [Polyangiaceae bacterium]